VAHRRFFASRHSISEVDDILRLRDLQFRGLQWGLFVLAAIVFILLQPLNFS
jgi:hypothetical protein